MAAFSFFLQDSNLSLTFLAGRVLYYDYFAGGSGMRITVIDGQGGGMGRALVERIKQGYPDVFIVAVGTNVMATTAMLRAGADAGATGENAVIYNSTECDVILGPMGLLLANSMYGELSPAMAAAISKSAARKILLPVARCNAVVAGVADKPAALYIEDAVTLLGRYLLEERD
jgi:hypothetical protein